MNPADTPPPHPERPLWISKEDAEELWLICASPNLNTLEWETASSMEARMAEFAQDAAVTTVTVTPRDVIHHFNPEPYGPEDGGEDAPPGDKEIPFRNWPTEDDPRPPKSDNDFEAPRSGGAGVRVFDASGVLHGERHGEDDIRFV